MGTDRSTSLSGNAACTYGISAAVIASVCQVNIATARRWKSGESRMPHAAAVLVTGDLGAFSDSWQGWRAQGETLVSPDGWKISRNDALAVPLMHSQISALRAELEKYRAFVNTEEQPAPPERLPLGL